MKSYLNLISISAKARRNQNRMTILCIIISVLLVTTIFSVADMMIRMESDFMLTKHGNWHVSIEQVSQDIAENIKQRSDVAALGRAETFNIDCDAPYYIGDRKAVLCGTDETYMTQIANGVSEGVFPQSKNEMMLTENAKLILDAKIGDVFTLYTPAGETDFVISGFGTDDKEYYQGQFYALGVTMTLDAFETIMEQNDLLNHAPTCYIQFQDATKAADAIPQLKAQYSFTDNLISENTGVMAMAGKSNNESMKNIYGIAAMLFFLVLFAGVLMISGSMNSNVAQRIQFFGMMRCIGASRQQMIRFVRLEALNWCKTAVPVGLAFGTAVSWGLCCWLRYGIGGEFAAAPVFKLSPIGLTCGAFIGVVTVLLAARSPAKRAAGVSPVMAVSGNAGDPRSLRHGAKHSFGKIENMLGVHHAVAHRKNWILMTASFSLSIILFLSFSVGMDLAYALLPSLRSWQPDVSLCGYRNALVLDRKLTDEIIAIPGVAQVWGSSYMNHIPVTSSCSSVDQVNLVSYDTYMMEYAKESVSQGNISAITGDGNKVMTIYNRDNPLKVGDTIQLAGTELEIACALSDGLFSEERIVICPEKIFDRLVGEQKYNLIGVQFANDADEQTLKQIAELATPNVIFSDNRERNEDDAATYFAARGVVYGFLAIIALITIFNMLNSISMSVSARTKQYGAMRAVGMDDRQLTRMISAEAFTYAVSGLLVGLCIGVPLSRYLYTRLITEHFGIAWSVPVDLLLIIAVFVLATAFAAVYAPVKRIRAMAITETINEL